MDPHKDFKSSDKLTIFNPGLNLTKFPKFQLKQEDANELFLNRRVEINEHTGTIRYVGKLKHSKKDNDIWIGIEWDDETRGKHNGTIEGIEYFKTNHSTAGSLIKFNKANFGGTFMDAVKFKYNFYNSDDEIYKFLNQAVESDLFIQANKKRIQIEFVGMDKVNKKFSVLENFQNVDLGYSYINHIGNDVNVFMNLKEINLQKTLLNKWSQFAEVLILFKNLEILNFSENILSFDEHFENIIKDINYDELKLNHLVLNKCKISFDMLIKISILLRNVQSLYLMGNYLNETSYLREKEFVDLNKSQLEKNLSNVTFLSLERNNIKDFVKVYEILSVYNLTRFNLNQNHISHIIQQDSEYSIEKVNNLKNNLQVLYIDFNQISDIKILQELSNFLGLVDLDILNNKFANNKSVENIKCELIGRLMKLQILNNTTISKDERKDFEKMYLKNIVEEYVKNNPFNTRENFDIEKFNLYMTDIHPNYFVLRKKYFDPIEDILENIKPVNTNTIKGNILEVTIIHKDKQLVKKFPKTTTFSNLRNLLSKLLKITGSFSFNIHHEIVTDETRTLDSYSFVDYEKYIIILK